MTLDKFSMTQEDIILSAGGPNRGVCWIQLSRIVQFEVVRENENIEFSYTIFNSYIFPFLGGLYCQECGPPLWVRGRHGTLAGLVSAVSWKLHCEGFQNIYKCQIVQINLQIYAANKKCTCSFAVALTHDWLVVVPGQVQTIIMTIFDLAFLDNGYKSPVLCHIFNLSGVLWNMNRAQVIILW